MKRKARRRLAAWLFVLLLLPGGSWRVSAAGAAGASWNEAYFFEAAKTQELQVENKEESAEPEESKKPPEAEPEAPGESKKPPEAEPEAPGESKEPPEAEPETPEETGDSEESKDPGQAGKPEEPNTQGQKEPEPAESEEAGEANPWKAEDAKKADSDDAVEPEDTESEGPAESGGEDGATEGSGEERPASFAVTGTEAIQWFGKQASAVVLTLQADRTGKEDAWQAIQDAFTYAKEHASDQRPCKIVFPAGVYKISAALRVYSNTYLSMKGARVLRCFTRGCMLRNGDSSDRAGGYDRNRNIWFDGGEWDGNAFSGTYGYTKSSHFTNLRFGHARNITLTGVTISNNVSAHCVEFGGVDGVIVKNCVFKDQLNYKEADTGKYNGNEAVQLDVIHNADVFVDYEPFDDAITKNVTVTGNLFSNVMRGVGSHTGVLGKYYENINISNNTFQNISQQAVIATNFRNARITGNQIHNAGAGVEFKYMTKLGTSYYRPAQAATPVRHDCASVISNNVIRTWQTDMYPHPEGVRVMGWNMTSPRGEVPAGDYYIQGISVTGNQIYANGYGIRFIDAKNSLLSGNVILAVKDKYGRQAAAGGIYLSDSDYSVVQLNQVADMPASGIMVNGASACNVIRNNAVRGSGGMGIQVYNGSASNSVTDNQILSAAGCGIQVSTNSSATLERNRIAGSKKAGIKIYKNSSAVIRGNEVASSGGIGIAVSGTPLSITISQNAVRGSGKSGVCIYGKSSGNIKITENTVDASGQHGILVSDKSYASITKNLVANSKKNGIALTGAAKVANITGNTVLASKAYGIRAASSSVRILRNRVLYNGKYGIALLDKAKAKSLSKNTLCNRGEKEIYVEAGVKSAVKSMDAVKVKKIRASAKKVRGTATEKTTVRIRAGKKKLKSSKLKKTNQFSIKIPRQKKGTEIKVEAVDQSKNTAYRIVQVK